MEAMPSPGRDILGPICKPEDSHWPARVGDGWDTGANHRAQRPLAWTEGGRKKKAAVSRALENLGGRCTCRDSSS